MSKIYDLHCHSTASDGILTPTEVVVRAAQQGVNVLALTDHDTINGLSEATQEADKQGIRLINGVELSTSWQQRSIHIVGLNFDKNSPELTALLRQQADLRQQRAVQIGEKLEKIGVENAFVGAKKLANGEVTRAHYARYLVQMGWVKNDTQAFKKYLAQGKSAYIKAQWIDIKTAIEVIHQAGGLAVLAHPLRYKLNNKWIKNLIADFKQWGGDGLEVAGCNQSKEQRLQLARWAVEFQLLASVGSDFHFPCGWVELGKSLTIPEDCQPIWQAW